MIIKSVYIGNLTEAFFEKNFNNNLNLIYSDDNNKGKTIVIQSIMYCLGNSPTFPASFKFEEYYYILSLELYNKNIDICRKKNTFIIKNEDGIFVFDTISEFKRYWNKNIMKLPVIIKDGKKQLVDFELFVQLFFIGQDKKTTHNIVNSGWFKKPDFYNMIHVMGAGNEELTNFDDQSIEDLKIKKKELDKRKKDLLKTHNILKKEKSAIKMLSPSNDRFFLEKKLSAAGEIKKILDSLISDRNNAIKRKLKNEIVIKELRSLNRVVRTGKILCADCGSEHISYESVGSEFNFDISTPDMRSNILKSIEEKVNIYDEEVGRLTIAIKEQQGKLNSLFVSEKVYIQDLLLAKLELEGVNDYDVQIEEISEEISTIKNQIELLESAHKMMLKKYDNTLENIVLEMNKFNNYIDSSVMDKYKDIFTAKQETHSGSEGTQFYLSKMYSFAKVLEHDYPIIIDSFRAEDLSSDREKRVIEKFCELNNQIIFTTTIKNEEDFKYETIVDIHTINYSEHKNYHLLQESYVEDFVAKLSSLGILLHEHKQSKI